MSKKMSHDELVGRLRAATTQPIPDHVQARHLAAIHAAATSADEATAHTGGRAATSRWRRSFTAVVTAATVVGPTGVALASQQAQPGDALYDVKRITERFASIVVEDLSARRRIAELRHLLATDAGAGEVEQAVDRALAATAGLPPDHPLLAELASLVTQRPPATTPPAGTAVPDPASTDRAERQHTSTVDEPTDLREPDRSSPAVDDDTDDDAPDVEDDGTDDDAPDVEDDETDDEQADAPGLDDDTDDDDTDDDDTDDTDDS